MNMPESHDARSGHVGHIALSTMERQRNEARAQVIALLDALEQTPLHTKRMLPDKAIKAIKRAQAYAEAWKPTERSTPS